MQCCTPSTHKQYHHTHNIMSRHMCCSLLKSTRSVTQQRTSNIGQSLCALQVPSTSASVLWLHSTPTVTLAYALTNTTRYAFASLTRAGRSLLHSTSRKMSTYTFLTAPFHAAHSLTRQLQQQASNSIHTVCSSVTHTSHTSSVSIPLALTRSIQHTLSRPDPSTPASVARSGIGNNNGLICNVSCRSSNQLTCSTLELALDEGT